jgi:transmembrane sensor
VRAVGTAFAIHLGDEAVDVLVTEGRVAVERPAAPAATEGTQALPPLASPVFVSAGGRLIVPNAVSPDDDLTVEALSAGEITRRLSWRGLRLEFSDTRLEDLVAVLNRESRVHIAVADPALADLRLSGIFYAENAEDFVSLLGSNYDVVVERRSDEIVLRSR